MPKAQRRATALLAATTLSRIPVTVFAVFFVVQSESEFGRYDAGGVAILCFSIGATINGAASGWLFGRLGQVRVAVFSGIAGVVVLLASAVPNTDSISRFWVLSGLIGLLFPPLHVGSRALYPQLLHDPHLLRIYSWDVSLIQISWIVVPVGVILVADRVGVSGIYLLLAATMSVGAIWYAQTVHSLQRSNLLPPPSRTDHVRPTVPWSDLRMYVFLGAVGLIMVISGLILPALIAVSDRSSDRSMLVLVWSIGSTLGSLLVNRPVVVRWRLASAVAAALVGGLALSTALAADGPHVGWFAGALFLLGFSTSPITGAVFYLTSRHFALSAQSVLFGLITSVQLIAEGVGSALSGMLLEVGADVWILIAIIVALTALLAIPLANPARSFTTPSATPMLDEITVNPSQSRSRSRRRHQEGSRR